MRRIHLPQKYLVGQPVRHDRIRGRIFDQRHAELVKFLQCQLCRRPAGDLLVRVAQPLADADAHRAKARIHEPRAELRHAALAADEREDRFLCAHIGRDVVFPPMQADRHGLLIALPEPRAEIAHRAQPRQHADMTIRQQREQFLRAAEKSRIPGHQDRKIRTFRVRRNGCRDRVRRDGRDAQLTGPGRYLQHPCRADQAVRMLDRCTDLARLRRLAAGPNAHNANMRHAPKRKPRTESRDRF